MFIKLIIVIVILACIGPFFIEGPDGAPLMTLDDLMPEESVVPAAPSEPVTVYKWQDEDGIWQFSTEPVDRADVQEVVLDGQVNTMPAPSVRQPAGTGNLDSGISALPDGMTSVAPDKLEEMVKTATELQDTVDSRKEDIDEAVERP